KLAQLKRSYDVDRTAACTASGLCLEPGGTLTLFNAGDSGVYRMRGGLVVKLTRDHTLANRLRDNGAPPELVAEAQQTDAHVITRAFGMDDAPPDILDLKRSKYVAGDVFVVCTDGLSDVLGDEEMVSVLSEHADKPAQSLVERALAKGTTDNVTAIVARVVDDKGEAWQTKRS
ncbi:MAG: serine/threonine-protein phosphatase, partial [Coriobacteriales bacterium]|nr:serine/threonine-protein phosphatase [Coriobacteriales bacterium]